MDPPRNVRAYSLAMQAAGVSLRERTAFLGLRTAAARGGRRRVTGVETTAGTIATERVLLTGGPSLREVGRLVDARLWVGAARHQVAVSEPHPDLEVERQPMVFDMTAGLYWRLEEGGLLWGMSNPNETLGEARELDWAYLRKMQRRLREARAGHGRRSASARRGRRRSSTPPTTSPRWDPSSRTRGVEVDGLSVACACGHGMMWGPAVARCAADLALEGAPTSSTCPTSAWTGSTSRAVRRSSIRSRCPSRSASRT